jgi:glutathione S-transferase
MAELEILGVPQSSFVRTVRIACEEKAVAYRLTVAMPHSPEILAINPLGKVPAMRCGAFQLFESLAIATYIDRAFPGPRLFPDDPQLCGRIMQWVSVFNTAFASHFSAYLQGYYFPKTPDGEPDRAKIETALPAVKAHLALLDEAIGQNGQLASDRFTFADMSFVPTLYWLLQCPESSDVIGSATHLPRYRDAVAERASVKATVPPPFADLARLRR